MKTRTVVVAAHGHCFDGLASAAMFTHFRSNMDPRPVRFRYRSCGYGPNMGDIPNRWLTGDENAIVDFRFVENDNLTWYFDHHITAFASEQQQRQALHAGKRYFYQPSYGSCTKLIVDVVEERYGISFDAFAQLVAWAEKIDSAGFASAEEAIDRSPAVMQLACVVEQHGDAALLTRLVPQLLQQPLAEVALSDHIQQLFAPIAEAQHDTIERIGRRIEQHGQVVFVDLHDSPLKASGKFVAYALAPQCVYSVALIRMRQHYKLTIGYNPWCNQPRQHDIAKLCQRYGGGGHPMVGAISLKLNKLTRARELAKSLVVALDKNTH